MSPVRKQHYLSRSPCYSINRIKDQLPRFSGLFHSKMPFLFLNSLSICLYIIVLMYIAFIISTFYRIDTAEAGLFLLMLNYYYYLKTRYTNITNIETKLWCHRHKVPFLIWQNPGRLLSITVGSKTFEF